MLYTYISHSRMSKTYYGVTFNYGDKKEVGGVIRDKRFVLCGSRPEPEKPSVTKISEVLPVENTSAVVEIPKPTETSKPVETSTEKPKTTRGRKPKFVESVVEEPTASDAE